MKIDISELLRKKITSQSIEVVIGENDMFNENNEVKLSKPLKVQIEIKSIGEILILDAKIVGELRLRCSRCLEYFDKPLELDIKEELSTDEESDNYVFMEDEQFDIMPIIENDIIEYLPLKILCDDQCKGLCQNCGTNLNVYKCNCDTKEVDFRLEKLKELFANE
jgi:uncharacterized protein